MGPQKYYTYALLDEHSKPYYIGKGSGNRVTSHKRKVLRRLKLWNYKTSGMDAVIAHMLTTKYGYRYVILASFDTAAEAQANESLWIQHYGLNNLFNTRA